MQVCDDYTLSTIIKASFISYYLLANILYWPRGLALKTRHTRKVGGFLITVTFVECQVE